MTQKKQAPNDEAARNSVSAKNPEVNDAWRGDWEKSRADRARFAFTVVNHWCIERKAIFF